jgi:hypothetical protein
MSLVIDWQRFILAPPRRIMAGADWQGRGPDYTLRTLAKGFAARGGTIHRGTEAVALMERGGACVGVETRGPLTAMQLWRTRSSWPTAASRAISTSCGRPSAPAPEKLKQRGAATGIGDGLRMAQGMGARWRTFPISMATCCRGTRSPTTRPGHIRSSTNSASPASWSMAAAGGSPTRAAVAWHWRTHRQAARPDGDLGHL